MRDVPAVDTAMISAAQLETEYADVALAHAEWVAASKTRLSGLKYEAFKDAKDRARKRFASERGWHKTSRQITVERLLTGRWIQRYDTESRYPVMDHCEWYIKDRKPAAILSHSYGTWEQCAEFAEINGLDVERLPYSWYYPGGTIAVLFTPKKREPISDYDCALNGMCVAARLLRGDANLLLTPRGLSWWIKIAESQLRDRGLNGRETVALTNLVALGAKKLKRLLIENPELIQAALNRR